MSTVPEALTAHQCGMTVFAFSLITNECILNDDVEDGPTAEEVIESGERREGLLMRHKGYKRLKNPGGGWGGNF